MKKLHVKDNNERATLCGGSGSQWCETDEVCRCEAYEAQNNVRIRKIGEMEYIPLINSRPKKDYTPFIIALLVLFVLALLVETFYINPYINLIETANASEPRIDDDHYHCLAVKDGMEVTGASADELSKHCARFGITL